MNEFSLIDVFFKAPAIHRDDVIYGIGDDAACLEVPIGQQLLISTDTLVADVHFLSSWDAYDIAWKAVMVNVSDMAAMAATPCWISLALTMPQISEQWLSRFSEGLHAALNVFNISLIGGDTTRGPLSLTLTIHGLSPANKAIRRSGAALGDIIWVSGELGAAALAIESQDITEADLPTLMYKLKSPKPRVDLTDLLQNYATAAIDISDGLSADLNHICEASGVGANLLLNDIPVHPLVKKYKGENAVNFALSGGDDYELCFTTPAHYKEKLTGELKKCGISCSPIGFIEAQSGLRAFNELGKKVVLDAKGYSHF